MGKIWEGFFSPTTAAKPAFVQKNFFDNSPLRKGRFSLERNPFEKKLRLLAHAIEITKHYYRGEKFLGRQSIPYLGANIILLRRPGNRHTAFFPLIGRRCRPAYRDDTHQMYAYETVSLRRLSRWSSS